MGVAYKLNPVLKSFIIEQKKVGPGLSCRRFTKLIKNKFGIKLSKSSINSIIKEAGLSLPVGRRTKKKLVRLEISSNPLLENKLGIPLQISFRKYADILEGTRSAENEKTPTEELSESPQDKSMELPTQEIIEKPKEVPIEETFRPIPEKEEELPPQEAIEVPSGEAIEISQEKQITERPEEHKEFLVEKEEAVVFPPPEKPLEEPVESPVSQPQALPVEETVETPEKPLEPAFSKSIKEQGKESVEALALQPSGESDDTPFAGAILLKAADYLVGGSIAFAEAMKNRLKIQDPDFLKKIEDLIYLPLFGSVGTNYRPCWMVNQSNPSLDISSYLNQTQQVTELSKEINQIISTVFREVRCIKVSLFDGAAFYLDGQLHTIWSTPQVPHYFSTTTHNLKGHLNKYFKKDAFFVIFMAPGYDAPNKEFFDFMLSLDPQEKVISGLTLYDDKLEEIEVIRLERIKKRFVIFGLWPWQYVKYRKIKTIGQFKPFYFEPLRKEMFLANIEVDISQPSGNKELRLSGCALKTNLEEKIRIIILNNLPFGKLTLEELANIYLNHWPNLEESFNDFSHKIELFTYTAATHHTIFSAEKINLNKEASPDITVLFDYYLQGLDLFVRWHFLPLGYEDEDFPTTKERFYSLKGRLTKHSDFTLTAFNSVSDYPYLKDVEYACCRINEREIILNEKPLFCVTT